MIARHELKTRLRRPAPLLLVTSDKPRLWPRWPTPPAKGACGSATDGEVLGRDRKPPTPVETRLTGAVCQLDLASHRDNFPKVNWPPVRVKHLGCTRPKTNSDRSDAAVASLVAYIGRDKLPTRSGSRPKIAASFHLPMASATNPLHGPPSNELCGLGK